MLVDGMTATNDLGLSDAVPGRVITHSDARFKRLRLGKPTITFQLTSASKLYWAGRPAMRIVQALRWLKPKLDNPDDTRAERRTVSMRRCSHSSPMTAIDAYGHSQADQSPFSA